MIPVRSEQTRRATPTVRKNDTGSGSVLAVAVVAASVFLTAMLVPLYTVLVGKQVVAGAADAAALAAADVRVGLEPGEPCSVAARIAAANGAELAGCDVDGLVVTVSVSRSFVGLPVRAAATAGPPGGR